MLTIITEPVIKKSSTLNQYNIRLQQTDGLRKNRQL